MCYLFNVTYSVVTSLSADGPARHPNCCWWNRYEINTFFDSSLTQTFSHLMILLCDTIFETSYASLCPFLKATICCLRTILKHASVRWGISLENRRSKETTICSGTQKGKGRKKMRNILQQIFTSRYRRNYYSTDLRLGYIRADEMPSFLESRILETFVSGSSAFYSERMEKNPSPQGASYFSSHSSNVARQRQ